MSKRFRTRDKCDKCGTEMSPHGSGKCAPCRTVECQRCKIKVKPKFGGSHHCAKCRGYIRAESRRT